MDLRQIECFLCLYREGSMTRAAGQLSIVQSALSTMVAKLEKELGVQLFDRSSRGVTPTVAGTSLYNMLLPLSSDVENIRQRMRDLGGSASGSIRVGVVPSLGISVVPAVLRSYCQARPDVGIRLVEAYSAELIERVEAGSLDFALVNHSQRLGGLTSEPVGSEELVLVSGSASPLGKGVAPVSLDELAAAALIVPSGGQGLRVIIDSTLSRQNAVLRPRLEMDALTSTLELVKSGEWVTILPVSAVLREIEGGALRIRRLSSPIKRDLVMVHHPRRPLSLASQQLFGAFAQEFDETLRLAQAALSPRSKARKSARTVPAD